MTPESSQEPMEAGQSAASAAADLLIVTVASVTAFAVELWARSVGVITLGAESRGVVAVITGAVVAVTLVLTRGSVRSLGFHRPKNWLTVPLWVVGILTAYIAAQALVPALVSTIIELPEPDLSRYDAYQGDLTAVITLVLVLPFTASIPEEIIYRGFLMSRLRCVFGDEFAGQASTVLVQALVFGAVHFQWGIGGVIVTTIMGLIWGTAFLLCGRNLWIVILAHSTGHVLFAVQLYFATPT